MVTKMKLTLLALALAPLATAPAQPAATPVFDSGAISGLGARNIGSAAMSGRIASLDAMPMADGKLLLYVGAASGGVWKSLDGGTTFTPVFDDQPVQSIGAVEIDRRSPDTVWVGTGEAWTRNSVSIGDGIYKTTDGGDTWKHLESGLPADLVGKVGVDVSAANPSRVYVILEAPGTQAGVYRSDDGGASFQQVSSQPSLVARPFYYTYIDADPQDPNTVYVNNLAFWKSTDGGKSWRSLPTPHGDNHGMWINPDNPDLFIQSNDGGANVTTNGGKTWTSQLNQPTAEIYQVEVDDQFPYRIYGAQQDTGWPFILPSLPPQAGGYADPLQLLQTGPGCETGPVKPLPGDPQIVYGVCKGEFSRLDLRTGQQSHYWVYPQDRYGIAPRDIAFRFQRVSPFEISPHDPRVIYHGSHVLHRTSDGGLTWERISPDLTAHEADKQGPSGEPLTRDLTGEEVYSAIYAVRESPLEAGVIWVGANDGPVHVTRDGGRSWTNVTPAGLPPGGRVQNIEASPHRRGSAYVAVCRYLLDDWQPYIFETADYGRTWRRLTTGANGIPSDFPTRVVREDPDREGLLYAGTEFGLFASFDGGDHWQPLQLNLPVTPVTDIRVHRRDLVLSTMGRGFWVLDDLAPLQEIAARVREGSSGALPGPPHLFAPRDAYRVRYQPSSGPGRPEYPPPGALIDYLLPGEGAAPVSIDVLDAAGQTIRSFRSDAPAAERAAPEESEEGMTPRARAVAARPTTKPGHNRFTWDLRHEGLAGVRAGGAQRGPLVVPGTYQVRVTRGEWSATRPLVVRVDPRVEATGVTQRDLEDQLALQRHVIEALRRAQAAASRLAEARQRLQGLPVSPDRGTRVEEISAVEARLVTPGGMAYPPRMLIDQLANVYRMIGDADQKVGRDAFTRFADLRKELDEIVRLTEDALKNGS
jgi:photosystem II stability/assembly factor-like uncharacterized protein